MEPWQKHMEDKVDKTFNMVKEMYNIVVGSDNYKDASVINKMKDYENRINELEEDKIQRDATNKAYVNSVKIVWLVVGGSSGVLIGWIINHFFK